LLHATGGAYSSREIDGNGWDISATPEPVPLWGFFLPPE
jgi:hypothetical protein